MESQLVTLLSGSGIAVEVAKKLAKDPALAQNVVDTLERASAEPKLVNDFFVEPAAQIEAVRRWNEGFGWGFTDEDFASAERSVPVWPDERLVALVLVPYLNGKGRVSGVERTFQGLWGIASSAQHANWRWEGYEDAGLGRLRLLRYTVYTSSFWKLYDVQCQHVPGLRWEMIDLGCNVDRSPRYLRSEKLSPNAGVLAAAALHPKWVQSMDGRSVPYAWIPGYQVCVRGVRAWAHAPVICFDRGRRAIQLLCEWSEGDCRISGAAVPFRV